WFIQELIAPKKFHFFDSDWKNRGSKEHLAEKISGITGISTKILRHETPLLSIAVAQRMAWAVHRQTTRIEDRAYCLLGIFNVNMPMLYGKEEKSVRRLQEEIIKSNPDMSIFAWKLPASTRPAGYPNCPRMICGILANSPDAFSDCLSRIAAERFAPEFSISNKGIKTQMRIVFQAWAGRKRVTIPASARVLFRPLVSPQCSIRNCGENEFVREDPWSLYVARPNSSLK
ncbi:hypothetical protein B0H66DRAFT_626245, partial [Apodospora peruviana]